MSTHFRLPPYSAVGYHVALFVTSLHHRSLAYSTIRTYISALSFLFRLQSQADPTSALLVVKALQGVQNLARNKSSLLPISKSLLHHLITVIPKCVSVQYDRVMFTSIFLLTYYACLRIGEVVVSANPSNTLQLHQLTRTSIASQPAYFISFLHFKHSNHRTPTITLLSIDDNTFCPVHSLNEYLRLRGQAPGPLFLDNCGHPVTRTRVSTVLKTCLTFFNLPQACYNTHSFRVGRTTQLAADNASDATIRHTGRWASNAYLKYIRPTNFTLPK